MSLRLPRRWAVTSALAIALLATLAPATTATAAAGPSSAQQTTVGTVKVRGQVIRPRSFSMARPRSLPQHTVRVRYRTSHSAEKHTFTGPLLVDVLNLTEPRIDPDTKNAQLRLFVTATGSTATALDNRVCKRRGRGSRPVPMSGCGSAVHTEHDVGRLPWRQPGSRSVDGEWATGG
ncbi:hypothetical protein [Nonomuraea helvata]|uniref:Uncharacterized protein n=1 Tax=Nonomuraea helvata TaxID=37484 RepID=A0ABV5S9K5_9ACTN